MVAPAYAAQRSELARKIGLGRKPAAPAVTEPAAAKAPAPRRVAGRMPASAPPNTHANTIKPIWKLVMCTYSSGCRLFADGHGPTSWPVSVPLPSLLENQQLLFLKALGQRQQDAGSY